MSIDLSSSTVLSVFRMISRGVVRIFSEVRTIVQIALHLSPSSPPPPLPLSKKKTDLIKGLVASLRVFFLHTK